MPKTVKYKTRKGTAYKTVGKLYPVQVIDSADEGFKTELCEFVRLTKTLCVFRRPDGSLWTVPAEYTWQV